MPIVWCSSVACLLCSYANDATFHFCKQCGYSRGLQLLLAVEDRLDIDMEAMSARSASLFASESRYDKPKSQLETLLVKLLASLPFGLKGPVFGYSKPCGIFSYLGGSWFFVVAFVFSPTPSTLHHSSLSFVPWILL